MFKLESYITPLLMGYLDKYVKLRQEDFQLSLWGGDAVLNNLDLRLDELEKVIQLPVIFQSGHIHELRLHVPWTKLGSEPVVITINTVECIIKVRDTAYDSTASSHSTGTPKRAFQQKLKVKKRIQPTEELPPGYLQSIVTRIINNVTFIINNLILKFVEDDIVLSVNIKSAECYSVDKEWNRAFVDLTPDDLAMRKVLNFADLTVCMDKTNSSGHIESYQEPVAYRCAVTCRLYMEYESTSAKFPRVTRFNLYCDTLNLSLTDTQLPMLVRLIELCIALYYGSLDIPAPASRNEAVDEPSQSISDAIEDTDIDVDSEMDSALEQGWVSWAWSYVPQILPPEDEELDADGQLTEPERRERRAAHVLSLGFYIHQGTILFKLTEKSRESTELPHKKIHFHPFLKLSAEGLGIEVLMQGLTFCDIQCGFTAFRLSTCGRCICGVPDEKVTRCNTLVSGGEPLENKTGMTYITNSLFDNLSFENRGKRSQHILDGEQHREMFTEQQALQRYGAFWVDCLYTFDKPERRGAGSSSSETEHTDLIFQKEYSTLRFVLGNTHLHVSSTLYHRVSKLVACAMSHQYQPYSSPKPSTATASEDRSKPSEEQIQSLEEFIPTQLLHLMVINPTVTVLSAEHPHCDVTKKSYKSRLKKRDSKTTEEPVHPAPLAAVALSATRFDLQITKPMYAERLVKLVTAIAGPSSNLLHHCHVHTQIKLFSFQAGLQRASWDGKMSRLLTLVPPCSFALYSRSLVLPKLWTNSSLPQQEWMYEIPNASLNVNKASCLLCARVVSSWLPHPEKQGADYVLDDSLLDDLFPASGESSHQTYPLLEIGLYGLEFKSCESTLVSACVASLSSLNVFLYTPGIGGKMSAIPILYGPNDTSEISEPDFFTRPALGKTEVRSDCITTTFQKPKHTGVSEAQALALIDCQGLCVWLDPSLTTWFHYCPQPRPGRKNEHPPVTLDLSLAQMTSPLNAMSNASLHSNSSPSHPGRQTASVTGPPQLLRHTSIPEEDTGDKETRKTDTEEQSLGRILAQYFPLIRMLHVQVELKPSVIFLPKTSIPNSESSSDILAFVHQARQSGRLSDIVVICVPSIVITSTMTKPMNIVQELPVTSIQGSLIGEKLPWTVKISNICAYSLHSGKQDPLFFLHPMDIVSTVAVNCKYSPPTSETISTLALCLHVDVGQPRVDISASQLQLFSVVMGMVSGLVSNAGKLLEDCVKLFTPRLEDKPLVTARAPASYRKSVSSTNRIESVRSADMTENITVDISEDFSHEGSPLHESIIDDPEETGVKLSLWLQLLMPKMSCTMYGTCPVTERENGIALSLEHFDLSMDSQNVYSKAKITLSSISIQHSIRSEDGSWSWTDPEGIVLSCVNQLPHNLLTVTNKMWAAEHNATASSAQPQETTISRDKKKSVLSVTFTCALCKNVKKRLRKANVDLPHVTDPDSTFSAVDGEHCGTLRHENLEFYFHEYLSEVCVKTEPIDIVLKPELLWILNSLVAGLNKGGKSSKVHTVDLKSEPPKVNHSPHDDSLFSSASVHNLPLMYADVGMIRVFIPKSSKLQAPGCVQPDILEKSGESGSQEEQRQGSSFPVPSTIINIEMDPVSPKHISTTARPSVNYSSQAGGYTQVQTVQPVSGNKTSFASSTFTPEHVDTTSPVNKTAGHVSRPTDKVCCSLFHDMMVVQIKSCLLQPYADNPLPRIAQEKEVFHRAVQSGFTHQPGAVIEDRQYQVDIKGVSVSTGMWDQVLQEMTQDGREKSSLGSLVQIPALDWNTFLMDSPAQELREIKLIPLVSPFDLCLVLAPPITYVPKENHIGSEKVKLICGFTSELNLTSDLNFYLNTSQVKLLTDIVTQFSHCSEIHPHRPGVPVLQASPASHPAHDGWVKIQHPVDVAAGVDSGVESDLSTFTLELGQRHVTHRPSPQISTDVRKVTRLGGGAGGTGGGRKVDKTEEELSKPQGVVLPLDILVTAGRISCTVYSHKILGEAMTLELPLFRERRRSQKQPGLGAGNKQSLLNAKDNLEPILNTGKLDQGSAGELDDGHEDERSYCGDMLYTSSEFMKTTEDSLKKVIPKGTPCMIPLIYVYVTQPHCIMAKHSREEVKIEVSCYDILIKAASDQHISAIDDHHIIPDSVDFHVHWLETRAGCPNPYTGIPPSLLTAKFLKEPGKPDTISLLLERPIRLKVSRLAVEQVATLCSEINSIFPSHDSKTVSETHCSEGRATDKDSPNDVLSLVERVEIQTSQVVVTMEMSDEGTSAGAVLSLEDATLEANIGKEENSSLTAHIQLKDLVAKTNYEKTCRHLIGPFSANMDGLLSWIPLSNDTFVPQVLVATEFSLIPVTFGHEHWFCLSKLGQEFHRIIQDVCGISNQHLPGEDDQVDRNPCPRTSVDFVQDRSYDDLRCGGFQFIEQSEGSSIQPDVGEIVFSGGDPKMQENSFMIWHYPSPRVITRIHLTPVPFSLSSGTLALDGSSSGSAEIPCVLQSWDELRGDFVDVAEFHLSENEPVLVNMPEPKPVNASELVVASIWRVLLLQPPGDEGSTAPIGDVAVLPSSLAACMCVDSACIPSLIPSLELSVTVAAAELHLCHHLKYNGSVLPKKLSLYDVHADVYEEQVFSIIRVENVNSTVSHVSGQEGKTSIKCSLQASCDVLEYGHLMLEEVLAPAKIDVSIDLSSKDKKQDINGSVQMNETRVRVGKGAVHTLSMAAAAWNSFRPDCSGPHLVFSYYTLCNNTTATIRFGQAGTDENIILKSREMHSYSWRSYNCPQMLHLCMDKPSWKWTEPFPIDAESTSVRNVTARDQSYLVIIKVKRLGNLQMQVTVFGQLIVANHLSQPISMRISHSAIASNKEAKAENGEINSYVIKPGTHLPSLVSSELLVNPVQFRLAGYATSWSHDIFLSGDRMKDNQMVKILLPDGVTYFHVWCRIFCQHFYGMPQKLIMLTPLYVVRTHLPHPLYIHLDSPKVKKSQEVLVRSQGKEFQFHCMGGDVTHQMSFRLCSGMQLSSPAVVLSTGLIGQLVRSQVSSMDIEQLCEQMMDTYHERWPYLTDDPNTELDPPSHVPSTSQVSLSEQRDSNIPGSLDPFDMKFDQQPSVDLNVRLSEYIPGCDTLLVEVSPKYLVHNATDIDLVIFGSEGNSWRLTPGQTLAPPLAKDEFKLSVKYQTAMSAQKSIPMSEETMDYRRYNGDIGRVLFADGFVHMSFQIFLQEANKTEVLFLTITSSEQHGIRVICIRERFALTNQTGGGLVVKLLALPLSFDRVMMSEVEAVHVVSSNDLDKGDVMKEESRGQGLKSDSRVPVPLLRWSTVQRGSLQDVDGREAVNEDITYVYYVSFALSSGSRSRTLGDWRWSLPVRIISSKDGHRMTTSVPDHVVTEQLQVEQTPVSHAVCVVTQQVGGVTHIVVSEDTAPVCIVENLCPFSLEFGQACDKLAGNNATVQEQVELVSDLPWIPAGGWCHYTPPVINSEFVTKDTINIPKLHFRAINVQLPELSVPASSEWSLGVQISGNPDAFVRLPGYCDLKIMIQMIGMVTHLVIRPVSKAEITAKEIRSRIMDRGEVKVVMQEAGYHPVKLLSQDSKMDSSVDPSSSESAVASESFKETSSVSSESSLSSLPSPTSVFPTQAAVTTSSSAKLVVNKKLSSAYTRFSENDMLRRNREQAKKVNFTFGVLCTSFTLALQDESHVDVVSDLMSVHLKDLFFAAYPVSKGPEQLGTETCFAVSIGEAQIDNQQYGVKAFDFPVILLPQKVKDSSANTLSAQSLLSLSVIELYAVMKLKAFLHVQIVTYADTVWDQSGIEMVDISLKPSSLYIEDTFIYRLVEELEAFIPDRPSTVSFVAVETRGVLNRKLPAVIKLNSYTLSHPIRVKHITIQPIKMLLSVHASLKLFLASDHTPLSMSKFERVNVYSTLHRISHTLAVHYASAAIFRAGIVVGSLEILGNPTGLVRSIGTGVSDFISLPYSGLTRGPGAFVTGLTMGFGSLVKNVSAGMITSVTNFASSVSRNMDRLSFDSTHLERQEENRRNRPVGVSDGLKQGLTGFGISLLGAVAGLADQPIQTLLASETQDKPRASASSTASGLVTGVGKGLVGIFTKPIGGAAEFVSQTGQGILHGTGLAQLQTRLEKPGNRCRREQRYGAFKYAEKILTSLPNPELLLAVPAMTFDLTGYAVKVELILTPDVLVVVNFEEDAQQQAFTLLELECSRSYDEDGKMVLQWLDQFHAVSSGEQSHNSNKDRIAAFIDTQNSVGYPVGGLTPIDQSDPKLHSDNQSELSLPTQGDSYARQQNSSDQSEVKTTHDSQSVLSPQYEFQMKPHFQDVFLTVFRLAKNKLQGKGFPV